MYRALKQQLKVVSSETDEHLTIPYNIWEIQTRNWSSLFDTFTNHKGELKGRLNHVRLFEC